ncbi:MAG TPA: FGGY family carbohydrate kinase [Spirochaetia bacterium]|nr:FGGY family carbohydrate kinase [Spirochaetia bacterium]
MNGCLPGDGEGTPLHREHIRSDSRSRAERTEILGIVLLPEVYTLTGNRVDEYLSLPKILWIKNHRPQVYRRTAYFLNSKDYLQFRSTGVLGETDYSDASLVSTMDLQSRCWADALIREPGLDPAKFPLIRESTALAGGITREAATALGLAEGVPVVVDAGDAACATRGTGVMDPFAVCACIGSSAWISTLAETPCIDPDMRIQNFFDLDGRKCNICGTVQSAGITADWVISLVSGYPVERGGLCAAGCPGNLR